jgi:hypothetical protein
MQWQSAQRGGYVGCSSVRIVRLWRLFKNNCCRREDRLGCVAANYSSFTWPHRWRGAARPDLRERWPSRLVATTEENRLSI